MDNTVEVVKHCIWLWDCPDCDNPHEEHYNPHEYDMILTCNECGKIFEPIEEDK